MLTLVTPTGDRPEAFAMCERWIAQQRLQPDHWIVVDDGSAPTRCTMGQTVIRRSPTTAHSLTANLTAGLAKLTTDMVAVIEDDDYYDPDYLSAVTHELASAEIVGEAHSCYYHVRAQRWMRHGNEQHASLCATAFRTSLVPVVVDLCEPEQDPFVDIRLWRHSGRRGTVVVREKPLVVGMKGLPGRPGTIAAHHASCPGYRDDLGGDKLNGWLGVDASSYRRYAP